MPIQIAYCDREQHATHLVHVRGLGSSTNVTSACGKAVTHFGNMLPTAAKTWPRPKAPWCEACMSALEIGHPPS
jgi:hypothetical protein